MCRSDQSVITFDFGHVRHRGHPPGHLDALPPDALFESVHEDGAGLREHVRLLHVPRKGQRAERWFLLPRGEHVALRRGRAMSG